MLKNPSKYNPVRFTENTQKRRNVVISLLAKNNKITNIQRDSLIVKPLDLSNFNRATHVDGPAPYFRSELTKWLKALFEKEEYKKLDGGTYDIYRDGLKIYTTIISSIKSMQKKLWSTICLQCKIDIGVYGEEMIHLLLI